MTRQSSAQSPEIAAVVAQALHDHGVKEVYGVCGDHINSLYRAIADAGIQVIGTRTESGAVQIADGYARATGQCGVAIVTGGPGHTNAITGLAVAHAAQSPVLVLSGLTPPAQRHRGGQQVMDQARMAEPVAKLARELVHPDNVGAELAAAFRAATAGTRGPVSLSIPVDVLATPADPAPRPQGPTQAQAAGAWAPHVLDACGQLLKAARRPVLVLGSEAWQGDAAVLAQAVRRLGIPVFTSELARGCIPDDGLLSFGYADPFFNTVFRAIKDADLVVLAGAQVDFHTCFGGPQLLSPDAKIIQIHPDPARLGQCVRADIGMAGDAVAGLAQLAGLDAVHGPAVQDWARALRQAYAAQQQAWTTQLDALRASPTIHPLQVCQALARHRTDRTGITIDGGDFVHWARSYFPATAPGHWMDATLMGNLGGSLPLAMGMQKAFPHDPVWAFTGDGGFGFYSWELSTAVQEGLPIKVIVGNDAAWGIEKRLQLNHYDKVVGCDLPHIRYDLFAEMVGARGFHAHDPASLDAVVQEFVSADGPALLNVDITPLASRPFLDFNRY